MLVITTYEWVNVGHQPEVKEKIQDFVLYQFLHMWLVAGIAFYTPTTGASFALSVSILRAWELR